MPPTITGDYHSELLNTMRDLARGSKWWSAPINLGGAPGPSGGAGIPVGGIYGQLIQTKVAYDSSEAAYSGIMTNIPSGTLVDNLAHIRSRLGNLETISGKVTVLDDGISQGWVSGIDFAENLAVTVVNGIAVISGASGGGSGPHDIISLTHTDTAGTKSDGAMLYDDAWGYWVPFAIGNVGDILGVFDEGYGGFSNHPEWFTVSGIVLASGYIDHSYLFGLDNDDHSQYVLHQPIGITVINESGGDFDWRMEGITDPNLFYLDAGNNRIGIGTIPTATLHLRAGTTVSGSTPLKFTSGALTIPPEAGAMEFLNDALYIVLSTGPTRREIAFVDSDHGAFSGLDHDDHTQYVLRQPLSNTVINEAGAMYDFRVEGDTASKLLLLDAALDAVQIGTTVAGAIADFRATGTVFNEAGADADTRFEGDTDANLLTLDAGLDTIGIGGVGISGQKLSVYGDMQASGYTGWNFANETWTYAPTTTNYCLNPSFEVNVTDDWTAQLGGVGGSINLDATQYKVGAKSMRIRASNSYAAAASTAGVSVANGASVVGSGWIRCSASPAGGKAKFGLTVIGVVDYASGGPTDASILAWEYVTVSWTNNTGSAKLISLQCYNGFADSAADVWFDACQLELGPATPYCDGTLGFGHAWAGTAHNSTSSRTASMFTVATDKTTKYQKGTKIKLTDTTTKYFYSVNPFYVNDTFGTRVTVTGGSDYSLVGVISNPFYSYIENPQGFPAAFNYAPTITGFSANPAGAVYRFRISGRTVYYHLAESVYGTSNSTSKTYSLPVTAATVATQIRCGTIIAYASNGVTAYGGIWYLTSAATALVAQTAAFSGWSATGNCLCWGQTGNAFGSLVIYEI